VRRKNQKKPEEKKVQVNKEKPVVIKTPITTLKAVPLNTSVTKEAVQPKTFTLPNGMVMDAEGNILSYPKENTSQQTQSQLTPTPVQNNPSGSVDTTTSIPTSLKVELKNSSVSYPEVVGANCEAVRANVAVLDQFGKKINGQSVTLKTTNYEETETTVRENTTDTDNEKSYARFYSYKPQIKSGVETLTFISGGIQATANINVRDGLSNYKDKLIKQGDYWIEPTAGIRVNPDTMTCI
jgi:hypothetical protein